MAMGEHLFEDYDDCFRSLTRMGADPADVASSLDHEKQHFEKAMQLGYKPSYGVRMVPDFPPLIDFFFIEFEGEKPSGQDMIDILLAPDKPGYHDRELAERIKSNLASTKPVPQP